MGLVKTNTLNIKYFSIISIILSISFFQCDKFSSSTWLYYNQTSCSDKWGLYTNFDNLKQKVENYILTKKSIKVYDVEVLSNGPEQNCLACSCTTGNIIKLKVMTGDVAELKTEGFYEYHSERTSAKNDYGAARHLVFMTYLNDVSNGGTEFYHQKLITQAEKGLTLIWPVDWTFTHRGVISPDQEKYITTGWYDFF
jgi:hypothetical protein